MTEKTNAQKFTEFATAVARDIKALEEAQRQGFSAPVIEQKIREAITTLRNELLGGELDASLDTLKELGEKLKALEGDDSIKAAILTKFGEITAKITELQQQIDAQTLPQNLVEIYQQAKNEGV